jgi:AcrR family transcriptional regulator
VEQSVKTRRYSSEVRARQAARTRRRVLAAARALFADNGYAGTTVAQIARRAKVSLDTVYAGVGRKPDLLLAVIDMTLGSADEPIQAEQRAYVKAIRNAHGCASIWTSGGANMRLFATQLRSTGERRVDLGDDEVADIVWSTTSVDHFSLLRSRGWSTDQYADHLRDLWTRVLLKRP